MSLRSPSRTNYERNLRERAAASSECRGLDELIGQRLRQITARDGIDFATALLYDRVLRSEQHGAFIQQINSLQGFDSRPRFSDVLFAVAPGAFYREFPHIDADGRLLRSVAAEFGCRTAMIPVPTTGGLPANARVIVDWLREQPPRPIILASLSKGGADVKLALQRPESADAFRHVVAWVNICGMLNGTPLVERLLAQPWRTALVRLLFWWRGLDFQMVHDLHDGPNRLLSGDLQLPQQIRLVNVVGFPLASHVTNRRSRMWRRALHRLGPNDGGVLLDDVCRLPGVLYPVWAADHYMQPRKSDMRALAAALLHHLGDELSLSEPIHETKMVSCETEIG